MRWILMAPLCLTGCGLLPERGGMDPALAENRVGVSADVLLRPQARPVDGAGDVRPAVPGGALGRTVASLGDAAQPGLWMKTPLVQVERPGRVMYPVTGKSVAVTLIPIAGPVTAGSRLSLQAMYELGAPLTGLPEIEVFAGG